jgi:hypothetical protein
MWAWDDAVDEDHIFLVYDAVLAGNIFTDVSDEPAACFGS